LDETHNLGKLELLHFASFAALMSNRAERRVGALLRHITCNGMEALSTDAVVAKQLMTTVSYFKFDEGKEPIYVSENVFTGEEAQMINMRLDPRNVVVRDGRKENISFSACGLELVSMPTSVSDFYDDEQVQNLFMSEVDSLIKRVTGCTETHVFDTTKRASSPAMSKAHSSRNPATFVHGDYTAVSGPRRIRDIVGPAKAEALLGKRLCIVNVWRSIVGTVESKPLAFLLNSKEASARGDVRDVPRVNSSGSEKERQGIVQKVSCSPSHDWVYFPRMTMQEAVLFKTYDSADLGGGNSALMHTAIDDPLTMPGAEPRQSMECRVICVWD
jgi:hypothetical protein